MEGLLEVKRGGIKPSEYVSNFFIFSHAADDAAAPTSIVCEDVSQWQAI